MASPGGCDKPGVNAEGSVARKWTQVSLGRPWRKWEDMSWAPDSSLTTDLTTTVLPPDSLPFTVL